MRDMGMNHAGMDHGGMDHGGMDHGGMDHGSMSHDDMAPDTMDHSTMDHSKMDHSSHDNHGGTAMDHSAMKHGDDSFSGPTNLRRGPGVANVAESTPSRLDEPGQGLAGVPHRVLRYSQLRSLEPNQDNREPGRRLELHLTGNMERYMWGFDGIKYSEVEGPIRFHYGERLRLVLVNNTMMSHPIHLHGMFMELVNGNGQHNPRKHTVIIKPAERLEVNITANEPGHWAFHCHMLYHMKAGMMHSVLVDDSSEAS